jgi:hypothetical protein
MRTKIAAAKSSLAGARVAARDRAETAMRSCSDTDGRRAAGRDKAAVATAPGAYADQEAVIAGEATEASSAALGALDPRVASLSR